jgi:hypothetical protein
MNWRPSMRPIRLRYLRYLVLAFALVGIGYRFFYTKFVPHISPRSHLIQNVFSPAPGLLEIGAGLEFIDEDADRCQWWKVLIFKKDDGDSSVTPSFAGHERKAIWTKTFDDAEHMMRSFRGIPVTFKLAPFQIPVAPGRYQITIEIHTNRPAQGGLNPDFDFGQILFVDVD